jgi:hypothetical protein
MFNISLREVSTIFRKPNHLNYIPIYTRNSINILKNHSFKKCVGEEGVNTIYIYISDMLNITKYKRISMLNITKYKRISMLNIYLAC